MKPAISIICPIFNMEVSLEKCIKSVLKQTFTDYELLLIDDGSTDESGKICDQYAIIDNRIKVIHKKNEGVSKARQIGIDKAIGEYTIHIDPDDWVEADMLESLYKKAKEGGADMVIADYYVNIDDFQFYEQQKPTALDNVSVLHDIFKGLHGNCWNKLIRRACYIKYGVKFPPDISFKEDFCVIVQLLLHPIKISYVNHAFYHYVKSANSLANTINKQKYHDQLAVIGWVESYLNREYPECLNILKADVACWLIETGFESAHKIRNKYQELLSFSTYRKLPTNRQIKIILCFFFGREFSRTVHDSISKIKMKLRL